jgi:hypothetical protein
MIEQFDESDPKQRERARAFMVPFVDQQIHQAVQHCWMALPDDKRNVEEVRRQILRLVDRALRDLNEDLEGFGLRLGG